MATNPDLPPTSWRTLSGTWYLRRHPAVRTPDQLTRGERAADAMRNGMGSWAFVIAALASLAVWMLVNRSAGFDPYPFILLNLVLSCVAALQGAILLIAGKRSDQIASELALDDYQTDQRALDQIAALQRLVDALLARQPDAHDPLPDDPRPT